MKATLLTFQELPESQTGISYVPEAPVEQADEKIFGQLNDRGIMVMPVGKGSNYLSVNFFTDSLITAEDMTLLLSLRNKWCGSGSGLLI